MGLLDRLARLVVNEKKGLLGGLDPQAVQPVFYSALEDAIRTSQTSSAPGKQWLSTLTKTPGVKAQEVEWSGIDKHLNELADKPVTRKELEEYMADKGMEKYTPNEEYMSERGGGMDEDTWMDEHGGTLSDRERELAEEHAQNNIEDYWPSIDIDEIDIPGLRTPAEIEQDIQRAALSRENALNRWVPTTNYADEDMSERAARERAIELDQLNQELERSRYLHSRDPETPDLFTGRFDDEILGDEMAESRTGYQPTIRDVRGRALQHFDERFDDEDAAREYADEYLTDYADEAQNRYVERLVDRGEFRDQAVEDVQNDVGGWDEDGDGLKFKGYSLAGDEGDYEELLLTLPDLNPKRGNWPSDSHWGDRTEDPVVAHVRYGTRKGDAYTEEELADYNKQLADWEATRDAHNAGMSTAAEEYEKASNKYYGRINEVNAQREAAGLLPVSELSYDERLAFFENDPTLLSSRAIYEEMGPKKRSFGTPPPRKPQSKNKSRVLAIEEIQSDWHQRGRERGYRDPEALTQLKAERDRANEAFTEAKVDAARAAMATPQLREQFLQHASRYLEPESQQVIRTATSLDELPPNLKHHVITEAPTALWYVREDLRGGRTWDPGSPQQQKLDSVSALKDEIDRASTHLEEVSDKFNDMSGAPEPMPFANNIWAAMALKRMLRKGADEGYDEVAWSGNIKNGSWRDGQQGNAFYDNVLVNEANKIAKKAGVQVGKTDIGQYEGWNSLKLTPALVELLKKGQPLFALPAAAGVGGLLSRYRGEE